MYTECSLPFFNGMVVVPKPEDPDETTRNWCENILETSSCIRRHVVSNEYFSQVMLTLNQYLEVRRRDMRARLKSPLIIILMQYSVFYGAILEVRRTGCWAGSLH